VDIDTTNDSWRSIMGRMALLAIVAILLTLLAGCTAVDETPPVISELSVSYPTETSLVIAWTTDEPANSKVEYGETEASGTTVASVKMTTDHAISLSGLIPGVTYHIKVRSQDGAGNEAVSAGHGVTAGGAEEVDRANAELQQAQAAITTCMAEAEADKLSNYNDTTGWNGSPGVIEADGCDAADYVHGAFRALYLVDETGDIVGVASHVWNDLQWDSVLGEWTEVTPQG
jgi:hypothetical protein